ncbi:MAG: hypothetical protein HY719_16495 [Planctomycetes bacterium]|nr:hypothetical protein [Planctomycetota bacterium]
MNTLHTLLVPARAVAAGLRFGWLAGLVALIVCTLAPGGAFAQDTSGDLEKRLAKLESLAREEANPIKKLRATGLLTHARLAALGKDAATADAKIAEAYRELGKSEERAGDDPSRVTSEITGVGGAATGAGHGAVTVPGRPAAETARSIFGVEYILPEPAAHARPAVAKFYAGCGAAWIKFQGISWQLVEPKPPVEGKHAYDWSKVDERVKAWQAAGFNIQFEFTAMSDWACKDPDPALLAGGPGLVALCRRNPLVADSGWRGGRGMKEGRMADYQAFVRAMVERYDGDGEQDMPGLTQPILYYEVESEQQHIVFWTGTVEDYVAVHQAAWQAVKGACPKAKVVLGGMHLGGLAWDNPSLTDLTARLEELMKKRASNEALKIMAERVPRFVKASLDMHKFYDVVEFHALGDYTEIPGTVAWFRARFKDMGAGDKEVWVGDATSALEVGNALPGEGEGGPYDRSAIPGPMRQKVKAAIKDKNQPDHAAVTEWFRREQVGLTVKKFVVAAAARSERVFMCALEDWDDPFGLSMWPYHGLADQYHAPRPAYNAMAALIAKVGDGRECARVTDGLPQDIWLHRYEVKGKPLFVAWCDDGKFQDWKAPPVTRNVEIPWKSPAAAVERFYRLGAEKEREEISAKDGKVALTLTERPLMITEEAP